MNESHFTRHPNDPFEYDAALSFAGEDRAAAESLGGLLGERHIHVLYDEFKMDEPGGKDVLDHLVNLVARKARYCVLFLSRHYPLRSWTEEEQTSVQERTFRDPDDTILHLRLDDSEIPGLEELPQRSPEAMADLLEQKLAEMRRTAGPPSKSHDLRSGNVPTTQDE